MRFLFLLLSYLIAPLVRRRVVLAAAREHDAYAHERVHTRKRPGFDADQRVVAITQRAQRRVRVNVKQVRRILNGA